MPPSEWCFVTNKTTTPTHADSTANYVLGANRYKMGVLFHGKDNADEAWTTAVNRLGGVQYEVGYDCDPFNEIKDGGGNDDINVPTWGQPSLTTTNLTISTSTGLWKTEVEVYVPTQLMLLGEATWKVLLNATIGDPEAVAMIFHAVTRQFGDGWVEASRWTRRPAPCTRRGRPRSTSSATCGRAWPGRRTRPGATAACSRARSRTSCPCRRGPWRAWAGNPSASTSG